MKNRILIIILIVTLLNGCGFIIETFKSPKDNICIESAFLESEINTISSVIRSIPEVEDYEISEINRVNSETVEVTLGDYDGYYIFLNLKQAGWEIQSVDRFVK